MQSFTVISRSPEDTAAMARSVASELRAGDTVLLNGGLAAGKTHFVKGLAAALGCTDAVTSPTFSIANFYNWPGGQILHMDAYRLDSVAAFRDLALDEYFDTAVTLVEWGALVAEVFPTHLSVTFATEDEARVLTFAARGDRWGVSLQTIARHLGVAE